MKWTPPKPVDPPLVTESYWHEVAVAIPPPWGREIAAPISCIVLAYSDTVGAFPSVYSYGYRRWHNLTEINLLMEGVHMIIDAPDTYISDVVRWTRMPNPRRRET